MMEKHENSSYESNQALTEGAELHTAISWTMTTMEEEGYNVLSFSTTPPPHHRAGTPSSNQLGRCWRPRVRRPVEHAQRSGGGVVS